MRLLTRVLTAVLLAGAFLAPDARAQVAKAPCCLDRVGEWQQKLSLRPVPDSRLSPAQATHFAGKLAALADIIHATTIFQPPLGIMPRLQGYFTYRQEGDTGKVYRQPIQGRHHVELYWFWLDPQRPQPLWGGESLSYADYYVNDPQMAMGMEYDLVYEGLPLADGRRIRFEPLKTGAVGGFPIYDDRYVVVTHLPRPLWIPVSREQYLSALIRRRQEQVDSEGAASGRDPYQVWLSERPKRERDRAEIYAVVKKTGAAQAEQFLKQQAEIEATTEIEMKKLSAQRDDAPLQAMRAGVEAFRQELARMSPAERRSQAWLRKMGDFESSGLLPAGTPDARPLVVINWDFLDRSRSRADWQVVVAIFEPNRFLRNVPTHIGNVRLKQLREMTDWARVGALLD